MEEVQDLGDLYKILGVSPDVTEKQIEKAYRKASLKCHPDRNKDDKDAAQKFDRLTRAKEFLLKPAKRGLYDEKRKKEEARLKRFKEHNVKTQAMRLDLERREMEAEQKNATRVQVAQQVSSDIKADFERAMAERIQKKQEKQNETDRKMRQTISKLVKVTLVLVNNIATSSIIMETLYELLAPYKLMKVTVDDYSAELMFETKEKAMEALEVLEEKKSVHGFYKKILIEEGKERSEDLIDELDEMLGNEKDKKKTKTTTLRDETTFPLPKNNVRSSPPPTEEKCSPPKKTRKEASADLLAELDAMLM